MASKEPAPAAAPPRRGMIQTLFGSIVFAGCAIGFLPTTIIVIVGMLPTIVAIFVDSGKERLAGLTVGCMNIAGVLMPVMALWDKGHTVENAIHILSQPYMLLVMYGGAALGALLYINTPLMVSGLLRRQAAYRLKMIEKQCEDLREEWGPEVTQRL